MGHLNKLFIVLLMMLITSCATITKYEGSDRGYLVYSQAATANTNYGGYYLDVRSSNGQSAYLGYLQNNIFSPEKRDFDDEVSNGIVRMESMSPGDYEIIALAVSKQGEGFPPPKRKEVAIPFSIQSNEITYIGEFLATDMVADVIFGLTASLGVTVDVNDRLSRDVEIIGKNRDIKGIDITKQIPAIKGMKVE